MQSVVFAHDGASYQFARESADGAEVRLFSHAYLAQENLLRQSITGGRTEAFRFQWQDHDLLLKHYRRGGYVRHFSKDKYLWTGLNGTRAFKEFALLQRLADAGLPAPKPFACRVEKHRWCYRTSLITHWVDNTASMTERVEDHPLPDRLWPEIGRVIRTFHDHHVCHEDLNGSNILIDDSDRVYIIDFDKAVVKKSSGDTKQGKAWRDANLKRFERSLMRLSVKSNAFFFTPDIWSLFTEGYLGVNAD